MKIKNKIAFILSFLVFTLSFGKVFARETNYYGEFNPSYTDFSDMHYEKYNTEQFNENLDEVKSLLECSGADDKIFEIMDKCMAEFDVVKTLYAISVINASKENIPQNNQTVNEAYDIYMDMLQNYNSTVMDIYNSDYRESLAKWYGEEKTEEFIEKYPSERFYELSAEEQKLINEYRNNQFGTAIITYNGEEYGFDDIIRIIDEAEQILGMSDIELANHGYTRSDFSYITEIYNRYLYESNVILGEIFIKLINVRDKIAKECGYDNYAEYAYNEVYSRDYTIEEVDRFRDYVKEYIVPLYSPLSIMLYDLQTSNADYSEEEIINILGTYIEDISSEMKEAFDYMYKYHLIDIGVSDKKETAGTAYTVALPQYRSAYLFESPVNDSIWQLTTAVHEFGHYNAIIHDPVYSYTSSDNEVNLDISEIHSQGLEALFMKYYKSIFGIGSMYEKISRICMMLSSIIDGCIYDEWQYEIYKNPGLTLDEINKLFVNISDSYGHTLVFDPNLPYEWIMVNHNFSKPMYYISYAMSAVPALEIWERSLYDFDGALDQYMKLTSKGSCVDFKETLAECGFNDVFSEDTLKSISAAVANTFLFKYKDIIESGWYYQAVSETSWLFGIESDYFMPDAIASRAVTAEAVGRMYGVYNGIEGEIEDVFGDVSSKYISWAVANDILNGYSSEYLGADDSVTREQAVTIIYRYAAYIGYDVLSSGDFSRFFDANEVSDWAKEAVKWAVSNQIIQGRENNNISPKAYVTRAELAQMLSNFIQNVLTN